MLQRAVALILVNVGSLAHLASPVGFGIAVGVSSFASGERPLLSWYVLDLVLEGASAKAVLQL